jgi:hypothetical protein
MVNLPGLGKRIINEVAEMLEDFIGRNGSAAVIDLKQFASGLPWAGYQARLSETLSTSTSTSTSISNDAQAPPAPRPTLSALTDDEIKRSGLCGRQRPLQ